MSNRSLVAGGHGQWFGAFMGDTLVAQMGIVSAAPSLARFQSVETHPDYRGRGLAGTLAHHVSCYGLEELGAQTLVMVADPEYLAIKIYRAIGFTDSERQKPSAVSLSEGQRARLKSSDTRAGAQPAVGRPARPALGALAEQLEVRSRIKPHLGRSMSQCR